MPDHHPHPLQHPITQDMPLPGHYPCLTLQLNVTRYASPETMRFVVTVREPTERIETWRAHADTCDWGVDTVDELCIVLRQALVNMEWLQLGKSH